MACTYFRVLFLACDGRRRGDPNEQTTSLRSKFDKSFRKYSIHRFFPLRLPTDLLSIIAEVPKTKYFYQKFVLFYRTGPKKILSVQQSSPAQSCRSLYGEGNERQLSLILPSFSLPLCSISDRFWYQYLILENIVNLNKFGIFCQYISK